MSDETWFDRWMNSLSFEQGALVCLAPLIGVGLVIMICAIILGR